jgi:uridine kinase
MSRAALLADLAARVVGLPDDAPRLVGVDGIDGVGKTVLADELAETLRAAGLTAVRVSIDGFHRPRAERYRRGRYSPEGYYRDSFDYQVFRTAVVDPLRPGGDGVVRTAAFDARADRPVGGDVVAVAAGDVVVVDGVFLHRPELVAVWALSVLLCAPWAVALARMVERDGAQAPEAVRRYRDGQRLYLARCRPERHASVVVDNTDLAAPQIVGGQAVGRATAQPRAMSATKAPVRAIRSAGARPMSRPRRPPET